jgi:hypothetical protein
METMEAQNRAKSKVDASSFFAFPFINISLSHSCLKCIRDVLFRTMHWNRTTQT